MRSALKDTTQRYKSLTGFAIYACRVRYIFDAICPAGREGDFYHIATDRKGGLTEQLFRLANTNEIQVFREGGMRSAKVSEKRCTPHYARYRTRRYANSATFVAKFV